MRRQESWGAASRHGELRLQFPVMRLRNSWSPLPAQRLPRCPLRGLLRTLPLPQRSLRQPRSLRCSHTQMLRSLPCRRSAEAPWVRLAGQPQALWRLQG
jgi:hypothetical protein